MDISEFEVNGCKLLPLEWISNDPTVQHRELYLVTCDGTCEKKHMCVCVRERERERERDWFTLLYSRN